MNRSLTLALCTLGTLGIAIGCSGSPPDQLGTGGGGAAGTSASSASSSAQSGGPASSSSSGGQAGNVLGPSVDKNTTLSGDIDMPATATIAAGVTLTLTAGATIHAGAGAGLVVKGKLIADGTAAMPVTFDSKAKKGPGDWLGIEVASGGDAKLTHVAMHDATTAFTADAGSTYAIDYILADTSSTIAELDADGTLGHGQLHGNGAAQAGDTIFISSASPKINDTLVDNSNPNTDQINVSGTSSSPQFDHMEVSTCHCAFHFNQGKNIKLTSSYIHDAAYGMMIIGSVGTQVTGNNFEKNTTNIGTCSPGGTVTSTGNYFDNKKPFDGSCNVQVDMNDAAMPLSNLGPRP